MIEIEQAKKAAAARYSSLVHEVFAMNPAGKKLLASWEKIYFPREMSVEGKPVESAKRDGENRFLRDILITINNYKEL